MFKTLIALAIAGAMSAPLAAQTAPQANEAAQTQPVQPQATPEAAQPAQPQMVKKCRRVPDYPATGSMLGPSHMECKMVPAKGSGSANGQQGERGAGNRN